MRAVLIAGMLLLLLSNNAYSQQITTDNTVNVPANGRSGGIISATPTAGLWPLTASTAPDLSWGSRPRLPHPTD